MSKNQQQTESSSGLPPGFKLTEEILNAEKPTLPPPQSIHYNEKHVRIYHNITSLLVISLVTVYSYYSSTSKFELMSTKQGPSLDLMTLVSRIRLRGSLLANIARQRRLVFLVF